MPRRRKINDFFENPEPTMPLPQSRASSVSEEDAEKIAKLAAEKVLAMFTPRVIEGLEKCDRKLAELQERLSTLERKIDDITRLLTSKPPSQSSKTPSPSGRTRAYARRLKDYLEKNKYILASEARSKLGIPPSRLLEVAEEVGAVTLNLEGDLAIMLPETLEEFEALLELVSTPDPGEAASKLGEYEKLFLKMLRNGLVYYDSSSRSWRRL
ncbi:MAG: hypothetical protein F7C35_03865 [Desulfurococcales archaeon]|nr:hypothetical protein [Desulfurococcales archaeon]